MSGRSQRSLGDATADRDRWSPSALSVSAQRITMRTVTQPDGRAVVRCTGRVGAGQPEGWRRSSRRERRRGLGNREGVLQQALVIAGVTGVADQDAVAEGDPVPVDTGGDQGGFGQRLVAREHVQRSINVGSKPSMDTTLSYG